MLRCEGYKMFRGTMKITPKTDRAPFLETGVWLYEPGFACWYCNGRSYPDYICTIVKDETL